MQTETFRIDSYIAADEAYHFARKSLAPRYPDRAHDHDYHEVLLIERGSTAHWINGQVEELVAGDMICLRPRDAHAFRASRAEGCEILNVMFRSAIADHFAARYGAEVLGRFFWQDGPMPQRYHLSGPRFERAINVAQELQATRRGLARIEEFLLAIVNRVVVASDRLQGIAPAWLISACAAARTEEVYRQGAAGLVAAAGRSHEHVCRAMQLHLGLTPSAYINRIRMEQAAQLLDGTDMAVSDIAERLGIENLGHFYRLFGRQYGTTPRMYRKHHQRDPFRRD